MVNHVHYFAYGSNMNPKRMIEREAHFFTRERATLKGFSLRFNKRSSADPSVSAANIIVDEQGVVEGFLYTGIPETLGRLDLFENAPTQYTREIVTVTKEDGTTITCITYIATPDWTQDGLLPTSSYVAHLLVAKDELPEQYVQLIEQLADGKP